MMRAWFDKILGRRHSAETDARAAVRTALQKAMRGRSRIRLEAPQGLVAATTIQQLTHDEIIVHQPYMSGMIYPLADGDPLKLSFIEQSTNLTCQTRCLGRNKTTGPRGPAYVYRLRMPETMQFNDRRGEPRADVDPAVAPDVQVEGGRVRETMVGTLADLSTSGMRIHTRGSTDNFEIGQELSVRVLMPAPVGQLDEVVEVQRLEREGSDGMSAICVSFRRRIARLETLMRMTTDRTPMPLEQAQRKIA